MNIKSAAYQGYPFRQPSVRTGTVADRNDIYPHLKRAADILLSLLLLLLFSPLMLLLLVVIRIETGENPLFIQERGLTLEKFRFRIYKLRTLRTVRSGGDNAAADIFLKSGLSDRITFTGRLLRKTGLDELPQLINVLKGEMSFIGPRPFSLEDLELMKEQSPAYYATRNSITSKPGISGYWQIFGDRSKGMVNLMEMEMKYEQEKSAGLDLFLSALTVPVVLFAKHMDAITINN